MQMAQGGELNGFGGVFYFKIIFLFRYNKKIILLLEGLLKIII